jgi:CubicO group peptidase (beta-lactamase class C family)
MTKDNARKTWSSSSAGRISPSGATHDYQDISYLLLGEIIEQVTGRPMAEVVRADVLNASGLSGVRYGVRDAMATGGASMQTLRPCPVGATSCTAASCSTTRRWAT